LVEADDFDDADIEAEAKQYRQDAIARLHEAIAKIQADHWGHDWSPDDEGEFSDD
jgi:hypothetical protein